MIVFDLQWVGFVALLVLGTILAAVWLKRRDGADRVRAGTSILRLLDQAPLGFLMLEGEILVFANTYVRQLLHLTPETRHLPEAEWAPLLATDRNEVRMGRLDTEGRFRSLTFASGRTAR